MMEASQSAAFVQSLTYEAGALDYHDFPQTTEPVWILGKQYSTLYDLDDLRHDILSRIWFTYRKGFAPIGTSTFQSDTNWGCMLRCGQMMLAEVLVNLHLGRDWRWELGKYEPKYFEILRMFQDRKTSNYSIHQIATMGVVEGKAVGQWFGPNTVAQVLRKLADYDSWSGIKIHIAMDNTVIKEDIKKLCMGEQYISGEKTRSKNDRDNKKDSSSSSFSPLFLVIPLRLGLTEVNPLYTDPIKYCFTLKHSVGLIGGKPNSAHWFIGYVGDELVFLDPHTTQPHVDIHVPDSTDESFHCQFASRLHVTMMDPSVAVGFFFKSEAEFDQWCTTVEENLIKPNRTPIFEICDVRPSYMPVESTSSPAVKMSGPTSDPEEQLFDTDDEFELLM